MSRLMSGFRIVARPLRSPTACWARAETGAVRLMSTKKDHLHSNDGFINRPKWQTLFLKPLMVKEGQYVPPSTVFVRAMYTYVIPLFMFGTVVYWYMLHLEYPGLWEKKEDEFERYQREQDETVQQTDLSHSKPKQ